MFTFCIGQILLFVFGWYGFLKYLYTCKIRGNFDSNLIELTLNCCSETENNDFDGSEMDKLDVHVLIDL